MTSSPVNIEANIFSNLLFSNRLDEFYAPRTKSWLAQTETLSKEPLAAQTPQNIPQRVVSDFRITPFPLINEKAVLSRSFSQAGPRLRDGLVRRRSSRTRQVNYLELLEPQSQACWPDVVSAVFTESGQAASIFLQQKLKNAPSGIQAEILAAITEKGIALMSHRFGNFVVQHAIEYCSPEQTQSLIARMESNVVRLAMDQYGTHVVQCALLKINDELRKRLIDVLLNSVEKTVCNRHGCHVWQRAISLPQSYYAESILEEKLKGRWVQCSKNPSGSLVVQTALENSRDRKKQFLSELIQGLESLCADKAGHWVILRLLERPESSVIGHIVNHVLDRAIPYSFDRYAGAVLAQVLRSGGPSVTDRYLDKVERSGENTLVEIASSVHGSYLVKWMIKEGLDAQKSRVATGLRSKMVYLRSSKRGYQCWCLVNGK